MKKSGSVTVFLTLLLTVIAAFILTLVSYVSGISDKLEAEYAADNAIRSCFAEYNRELYKRFHILLIDSSYRASESGADRVTGHFLTYMQNSMSQGKECIAEMTDCRIASEDGGEYIRDSALRYAAKIRGAGAGLTEYTLEVLGNCDSPAEGAYRAGETEYVIFGPGEDEDVIYKARSLYEDYSEESYEEYLRERLDELPEDVTIQRLCELMTEYMRANTSPGFDLSTCYYDISFLVRCKGKNFKEYDISKEYRYDL